MESSTLVGEIVQVEKIGICRLCMKDSEYCISIFVSYEAFRTSIGKAIEDLLILKVAEGDGLPSTVCSPCVRKLGEFRDFKKMCVQSATELKRITSEDAITSPVKVEPIQLQDEGEGINCNISVESESLEIAISNDIHDPLALENAVDMEGVNASVLYTECDGCEEEDCAEEKCCTEAVVYLESTPLDLGTEGDVRENNGLREPVYESECHSHKLLNDGDSSPQGGSFILPDPLSLVNVCHLKEEEEHVELMADVKREWGEGTDDADIPVKAVSGSDSERLDVGPMVASVKEESSMVNTYDSSLIKSEPLSEEEHMENDSIDGKGAGVHSVALISENQHEVTNILSENERENEKLSIDDNISAHTRGHLIGMISSLRSKLNQCLSVDPTATCSEGVDKSSQLMCGERAGRKFNLRPNILENPEYDMDKNVFKCGACEKQFKYRSRWVVHTAICSSKKGFKCDMCGDDFKNRDSLVNHVTVHAGEKCFKCNTCGKDFASMAQLRIHSAVHTDRRPFKCNTCAKDFKWKTCLANHLKFHARTKPFKCDVCGKGFAKKYILKEHSNIHTGLKPFVCKTCGNCFASRSNLAQHEATHSSKTPFRCVTCGKAFKVRSYLLVHMNIHKDELPFKCERCGKQFKWRWSYNRHCKCHCTVGSVE